MHCKDSLDFMSSIFEFFLYMLTAASRTGRLGACLLLLLSPYSRKADKLGHLGFLLCLKVKIS